MAYKDEYEVARLYTDGSFQKQLASQFEGDYTLEFQMAPPLFSYVGRNGEAPRKIRCGPWMMTLLRVLARSRHLRGTCLDVFGKTVERRFERELIDRYESRMLELLPQLTQDNIAVAIEIAAIPERIRGFGYVKTANLAVAREREEELLHRFDPARYPKPLAANTLSADGVNQVHRISTPREKAGARQ